MKIILLFLLISGISNNDLFSQQLIELKNPSFEDYPHRGSEAHNGILKWYDCGRDIFPNESPPDILPLPVAADGWHVYQKARHGFTYLSMVVRWDHTYESMTQYLSTPLKAGMCYRMSVYLCRSDTYLSSTRNSYEPVSFSQGAHLRLWGGNQLCEFGQILVTSPLIDHTEWLKYTFTFTVRQNISHITIQALHNTANEDPYNGHVLIDGFSSIMEFDCRP